jgi:D-lyxose ketol-isomerase
MKRSEVNNAIKWAEKLLAEQKITLPPFGYYTEEDWTALDAKLGQIKETMLGWDVSDFGSGDFEKVGAVLFTVRNGSVYDSAIGTPYAEKYILLKDGCEQEIPLHYHISKTEDIINRGHGVLCVELYNKAEDGGLDTVNDVVVRTDAIERTVKAGEIVELGAGESITLTPYMFHRFYAKTGCGDLVVGEVSKINDDHKDNIFAVVRERFCEMEEDEAPYRRLVADY